MPVQVHDFKVGVSWSGGREGHGALQVSAGSQPLAVPPEFQGPGGATNPEELLTGAIAGCYTITFGIVAANRKIPVIDIQTVADGQVEQSGASFVYKSIVVRPTIRLTAEATDAQVELAKDMALKTDAYCIVTNAVRDKVAVTLEPTVIRG